MSKLYLNYQIITAKNHKPLALIYINGIYYYYTRQDDLNFTTQEVAYHLSNACPRLAFELELSIIPYCKITQKEYKSILSHINIARWSL